MASIPRVRIELRPSTFLSNEIGLFAACHFDKDSVVVEAASLVEIFHEWDEYEQLDPITKQKVMDFCCGSKSGFFAPPDFNHLSICWYMNHSCEPNVGFDSAGNFVAMRRINADEELLWDYGFGETNPAFSMPCRCGCGSCRGIITGNDWVALVKDETKRRYMSDYVMNIARRDDHESHLGIKS